MIIIGGWFGVQIAQSIDGTNVMHQHSVSIHLYIAILTIISLVYTTNRGFLLLYPNSEKDANYSNESFYIFMFILILNLLLVFSGSFIRTFIDNDLIKVAGNVVDAFHEETNINLQIDDLPELIEDLEDKMKKCAKDLDFEQAAKLRDRIHKLRKKLVR